jgi:hypothetical protein
LPRCLVRFAADVTITTAVLRRASAGFGRVEWSSAAVSLFKGLTAEGNFTGPAVDLACAG